jgi:hypothetical protein
VAARVLGARDALIAREVASYAREMRTSELHVLTGGPPHGAREGTGGREETEPRREQHREPAPAPVRADPPRRASRAEPGNEARAAETETATAAIRERAPRVPERPYLASPRTTAAAAAAVTAEAPARLEPGGSAPPVRVHAGGLAEAIHARLPRRDGSVEVLFELEPADLGPVRVHIEARGSELRVRILAGSEAALDTLGAGIARLSAQLSEAGFRSPVIDLALADATQSGARERHEASPRRERSSREQEARAQARSRSGPATVSPARLDRTI